MSSAANLYPAPGAVPTSAGQLQGNPLQVIGETQKSMSGIQQEALASVAGIAADAKPVSAAKPGKLAAFEGFLKKAGHIAGIVLADIIKYAIPVASIVAVADPAVAPAMVAFTASVRLVQATVISVQQKWSASGSEANNQKLADVLEIVEQPILTMFAQSGLQVDRAYVTNLVNGVVAILNAQPGGVLPKAA